MSLFHLGHCGHGSPCDQLCYQLHDGMYECDCTDGFELDSNGYSCRGIIVVKLAAEISKTIFCSFKYDV